jgi:hypothetical protein
MRLAAFVVVAAVLIVSVGVGLYDYRAGIVTFGLLAGAAGVWNLTQE